MPSDTDLLSLLTRLASFPSEEEWFEFKVNNSSPEHIGQYISALSNGAMLSDKKTAYLVFGIDNGTKNFVGTKVRLKSQKRGNEPFQAWLYGNLSDNVTFEILELDHEGKHFEVLKITPTFTSPVLFKKEASIRIGDVTTKLRKFREKERALWRITSRDAFVSSVAESSLTFEGILSSYDIDTLLIGLGAIRLGSEGKLDALLERGLIIDTYSGKYDTTNLLALLCCKDLSRIGHLARKAFRVIEYIGNSNGIAKDDVMGKQGYALRFDELLEFVMERVKLAEDISGSRREVLYKIPKVSVREVLANALIHQDFDMPSGPIVEIYSNRIQVTNPGEPLVKTERFIDTPSKTRNERLAESMRLLRYCEERGSGVDRAVNAIENAGLPPPSFRSVSDTTVVTLFAMVPFGEMSPSDRKRACYQHACLKVEQGTYMTNASLRERFGLNKNQYPQVSKVITSTKEDGLIKPLDVDQGNRGAKYIPFWYT